jgi:hypothetical protein
MLTCLLEASSAIQLHGRLPAGQDRGVGGRAPPGMLVGPRALILLTPASPARSRTPKPNEATTLRGRRPQICLRGN